MKGSRNPQSAPICTQRTARRKFRYSQVVVFERTFFAKRTNLHGKYDHPFTAFTLDQLNLPSLQAAGVKGPFSLHMGGADNSVSDGTSVAEQDKNRRTIIILVP